MNLLHKKHTSHEAKVLAELKKAGHFGCYGHDLSKNTVGGWRFSEYIRLLRKEGHHISTVRVDRNTYKYFLES